MIIWFVIGVAVQRLGAPLLDCSSAGVVLPSIPASYAANELCKMLKAQIVCLAQVWQSVRTWSLAETSCSSKAEEDSSRQH